MKKIIYTGLFLLLLCSGINGQITKDEFCGANESFDIKFINKPWYGNNQYLYNFLNSCGYEKDTKKTFFRVPVKFWIYRRSDGSGGVNELRLKELMKYLNHYNEINNTGIKFYLRPDVSYVDSDKLYELRYILEAPQQTFIRKSKGCINIHLVKNLVKKRIGKSKIQYNGTYNLVSRVVIIRQNIATSSLTHEIGHYFGLEHPHRHYNKGKRRQESVSRTRKAKRIFRSCLNCEINGDAIADTPAEPNLTRYTNKKCKYNGHNVRDNWGEKYKPKTDNIMSYTANRECRTKFTKGQIAVMLKTASDSKYAKSWSTKPSDNNKYNFDYFEPDNSKETAAEIFFNTKQKRTFHKIYSGKKNDFDDDTDWLFFEIKSNVKKSVKIKIAKDKKDFPEMTVSIYSKTGKIKESKIKGVVFKTITMKELAKGKYYIKIKKNNKTKNISEYKIEII